MIDVDRKLFPVEILFPTMKISRRAYNAAQAYIDETVLQKGVVESYMYGFRAKDDPEHIIRDLYFPIQHCAAEGVEVHDPLFPVIIEAKRAENLILNSWIHHHCYGALRPSGPRFPVVNDKDSCGAFLNKIGEENYKIYAQEERRSIDDFFIEEKEGEFFLHSRKSHINFVIKLKDKERKDLKEIIDSIGTMLPTYYSYIGCIIMNPSVSPNILVSAVEGANKILEFIDRKIAKAPEHYLGQEFQQDICKDPYAGYFLKKWSYLNTSDDRIRERQVSLEIIDTNEEEKERDIIKKEVAERALKMKVANSLRYEELFRRGNNND